MNAMSLGRCPWLARPLVRAATLALGVALGACSGLLHSDAPALQAWTLEPPGFHLHAWSGPGQMVTHVAAIGSFDGPHPFHEGGRLID